ncbi:flagellar protein FliS [Thermosulfurimonas marina]|uniref:Flagellar secretion chaperone FliS n=1 Tax=Thermosulfurimonas marina TaxID=2047767 RepID=A0A6H1WTK6_9BACT|nr:flagellar export chaperone FliS [Thermosulfurimonas marina]QJA06555.1 flagellar protein FliS [Thermosulfurimonas marina]
MINRERYLENLVSTANTLRLVILLYDKAVASLKLAAEIMEKPEPSPEEINRKYEALGRAGEILAVLEGTLDLDRGGEIARNLREIYEALSAELLRVTAQDDPETVRRMVKVLSDLREAWAEAEVNLKKEGKLAPEGRSGGRSAGLTATL